MKAINRTSRLLLLLVVDNDDVVHLPTGNISHLDGIIGLPHQQQQKNNFTDAKMGLTEFQSLFVFFVGNSLTAPTVVAVSARDTKSNLKTNTDNLQQVTHNRSSRPIRALLFLT